jgi:integrase/recombinase XerD
MARGRQLTRAIELEERTLAEASAEFFKHNKAKNLSAQTQQSYINKVNKFILFYGATKSIASISPKNLDDYMYELTESGIKPITVKTDMRHLRAFLNFCASRGYMEELDVPMPRVEETIKEAYTNEELALLLRKPQTNNWVEYRNWVMVNYFYGTGQRLSTVLNIKVKELDLTNHQVKLSWNKDKRQKYMPLSSAIVDILREYIYVSGLEAEDWLFPEYEGGQLKQRSAQSSIEKYNRSRGVEKTSIHLFRHTFAKNYIMNGGNPAKLQKLLNHKTIHMTMHYVNLYGEDISIDLDNLNPLDSFKRNNHSILKRKRVG